MTLNPFSRCWRYLAYGSDVLILPRSWLRDRMPEHDHWTRLQLDQGSVVKDTRQTRNEAFWANVEAKTQQPESSSKVTRFQRKAV